MGAQTDFPSGLPIGAAGASFILNTPETKSFAVGPGLPGCGTASSGGAKPLFEMWLLTGGGKCRILVSETQPPVERQEALCSPGKTGGRAGAVPHGVL